MMQIIFIPILISIIFSSSFTLAQWGGDGAAGDSIDNEVYTEFAEKLSKFSLNVFKNTVKSPLSTPTALDAAALGGGPLQPRATANLFMAPLTAVSPLVMRSLAFESMFESVEEVLELMRLNRLYNHHFGGGGGGGGHHSHHHHHQQPRQQQHPHQLANVFHQILGLFNPMQWDMAGGMFGSGGGGGFFPPPQQQSPILPPVYNAPPPFVDPAPVLHRQQHAFRGAGSVPVHSRLSPLTDGGATSAALTAPSPSAWSGNAAFKHNPNDGLQVAYFSKFLIPSQFHVNQTFAQHLHSTFGADVAQIEPHASASQVVSQLERMLVTNSSTTTPAVAANEVAASALATGLLPTTYDNTSLISNSNNLVDANVVRTVGKTFERLVQPSWFEQQQLASPHTTTVAQPAAAPAVVLLPPPVDVPLSDQANAMFVNGVDVNAQWEHVFDPRQTRREQFHASLLDSAEVSMMHQDGIFNVGQEDNIIALKLPLRGRQHSMLIMMPKRPKHTAQANIKQIVNELSWDLLRELKSEMKPHPVRVGLPRFRTTSALNMMQPLRMAGLRKQPTLGDYAGAFTEPLAGAASVPSQILHFANIDINEAFSGQPTTDGSRTSAAYTAFDANDAARSAAFALAAGHEHVQNFIADRPFVYLIQHEATGTVLFAGKVENPAMMEPSLTNPALPPAFSSQLVQAAPSEPMGFAADPTSPPPPPPAVVGVGVSNTNTTSSNGVVVPVTVTELNKLPPPIVSGYSTNSVSVAVDPQSRLQQALFDTTGTVNNNAVVAVPGGGNNILQPAVEIVRGVVVVPPSDPVTTQQLSGTQVLAPLASL